VAVAYLIFYPTVATARTQALLRIYELLPVQDPAKTLLFSPQENAGTVRNDPTKGAALYDLAVRLDLDDVRALVSQHPGRNRSRDHSRQIQHSYCV
jgi:hypothetical protein